MYLTFESQLRVAISQSEIANLKRKGWVMADPPSYNSATHYPPTWQDGGWIAGGQLPPTIITVTKRSLLLKLTPTQSQTLAAFMSSMPEGDDKRKAQIYYRDSTTVSRAHPMVGFFGAALNLDSSSLDALFAEAQAQDLLESSYLS